MCETQGRHPLPLAQQNAERVPEQAAQPARKEVPTVCGPNRLETRNHARPADTQMRDAQRAEQLAQLQRSVSLSHAQAVARHSDRAGHHPAAVDGHRGVGGVRACLGARPFFLVTASSGGFHAGARGLGHALDMVSDAAGRLAKALILRYGGMTLTPIRATGAARCGCEMRATI